MIECRTPAPSRIDIDTQEVDWPDAIPVEIPPQNDQQNEQSIPTEPTYLNLGPAEIPQGQLRRGTISGFRDIFEPP